MSTAILVDGSSNESNRIHSSRRRVIQTDANTIYVFFQDESPSSVGYCYRKSTDGGLTWAAEVALGTGVVTETQVDLYADDWDSPSVIYIWYWRDTGAGTRGGWVRTLTLGADTLGTAVLGTGDLGASAGGGGGGVCVATSGRVYDAAAGGSPAMAFSDDNGATFSPAAVTFTENAQEDICQMWADPESSDPDDVQAIFFDEGANQLSRKRYDASADTISEATILNATFTGGLASVIMPNGHLYVAVEDGGAIKTFDIYGAAITARTSVVSSGGTAPGLMRLATGRVYCFYVRAGAVYYKLSVDAMVTWQTEQLYSSRANTPTELMLPVQAFGDNYFPVVYREVDDLYIETPLVEVTDAVQHRLMLSDGVDPDIPILNITPENIAENAEVLTRVSRGRDSAILGNPPRAGTLETLLTNVTLGYALDDLPPGLAVRLNKKYDDGVTDEWYHMGQANIEDTEHSMSNFRSVIKIRANGPLAKLAGRRVSTELYKAQDVGTLIGHLLDASNFPSHLRDIDTGDVTIPYWWVSDGDAFDELIKLLNSEGITAELYEAGDGKLTFRNRSARYDETRSTTIQHTISATVADVEPYLADFEYTHGWREIVNYAQHERIPRTDDVTPTTVWENHEGASTYLIAPSGTKTFIAIATEPFFDAITPVLNTDYSLGFGTVTVTIERTSGQRTLITFTAGAGGAQLGPAAGDDGIKLRATTTINGGAEVEVSGQFVDASASITAYGLREWRGEMSKELTWYDMRDNLDAIIAWKKDPRGRIRIKVKAHSSAEANAVVALAEIGDRLRVKNPNHDFDGEVWIERLEHEVVAPAGPAEGPEIGRETSWFECSVISVAVGSGGTGVGEDNPYDEIDHGSQVGPDDFSEQEISTVKGILAGAGI